MEKQLIVQFGSWTQAIGTVTAAIGSTPSLVASIERRDTLNLWGNVLQATGNAVLADTEEAITIQKIGNQIQAIGNSTIITGSLLNMSSITEQVLYINGNWLQAIGAGIAIKEGRTAEQTLLNIGNFMQMTGNSLQAIGGVQDLKNPNHNNNNQTFEVSGSWIQAAGAVLQAIIQSIK